MDIIGEEGDKYCPLGRRIIANRIVAFLSAWLPLVETAPPPTATPMTDIEAKAYGDERMEFGHYAGTRIDEVPRSYLEWLADSSRTTAVQLSRYLKSNRIRSETTGDDHE